eukprot:gnl/MRDRNA2_/MRDRNA2_105651_c0_seq1.p1 gnl/MRDRNA2_/MRDRNA2_105651_c0~~gnl/MRDRNA2_/MRDRNA2_105651_c0_seq1.p1  ORF type:complete len:127 (+),score=11.20 gnl/MRDRNA2_/MRDRNA2_105651_c0_seq1:92-472(+)
MHGRSDQGSSHQAAAQAPLHKTKHHRTEIGQPKGSETQRGSPDIQQSVRPSQRLGGQRFKNSDIGQKILEKSWFLSNRGGAQHNLYTSQAGPHEKFQTISNVPAVTILNMTQRQDKNFITVKVFIK